jgi:hypothetical protein
MFKQWQVFWRAVQKPARIARSGFGCATFRAFIFE